MVVVEMKVAEVEQTEEEVVVWWWQWRRVGHLAEARAQLGLGLEVGVQRAVEEGEHLPRGEGGGGEVEVVAVVVEEVRWRRWQWWKRRRW